MAHQYIEQLDEKVRASVFGNVGTIMTFRVGSPDAVFLENEFMPRFTQEDLVNLAKFQIYLRLMIDGVASDPFSATTLPPIAQRTHSTEVGIQLSRQNFSRPRPVVEKAIMDWSEMGGESTNLDTAFEHIDQEKKDRKDARKPKHEYNCTRCNKDIVLPVELDRSRPIYCDDCIEIVREERNKKGKGGPPPVAPKPFSKPPDLSTPPAPFVSKPPQKPINQESIISQKKDPVSSVPQMASGEFVRKETQGEVGLSALSSEKKSDTVIPPKPASSVSLPSPSPVSSPSSSSSSSSSVPSSSQGITSFSSGEIPKKKRRRRKRKSSMDGMQGNQPSSMASPVPPSVSKSPIVPKPPAGGSTEESVFPW